MKKENGFTLVELAIVLVIIGLLIGGILAAQSMIQTSKITSTVAMISQLDAGVESFKSKYNYLPGDAPGFGGNGNGAIEGGFNAYGAPWPSSNGVFGDEIANFWPCLNQDKFGSPIPNSAPVFSSNSAPKANVGTQPSYFLASDITNDGWYANLTNPENYYFIATSKEIETVGEPFSYFWPTSGSGAQSPALTAAELNSIDIKIDDGLANSGNVLSGSLVNSGIWLNGGIMKTALPGCSNGSSYILINSTPQCMPLIRIGASAGDQQ